MEVGAEAATRRLSLQTSSILSRTPCPPMSTGRKRTPSSSIPSRPRGGRCLKTGSRSTSGRSAPSCAPTSCARWSSATGACSPRLRGSSTTQVSACVPACPPLCAGQFCVVSYSQKLIPKPMCSFPPGLSRAPVNTCQAPLDGRQCMSSPGNPRPCPPDARDQFVFVTGSVTPCRGTVPGDSLSAAHRELSAPEALPQLCLPRWAGSTRGTALGHLSVSVPRQPGLEQVPREQVDQQMTWPSLC